MNYPSDFSKWTTQMVEDTFGIYQVKNSVLLDEWLDMTEELTENEITQIENRRQFAENRISFWNESDIKFKFLGPLMQIAELDTQKIASYTEHKIGSILKSIDNQDIKLSGKPDLLIAKGRYEAQLPYFCFQEYKKQRGNPSDPQGQVLAAMLIAQQLNPDKIPIYGSYSEGREWFFLTLENKEYALSKPYILTQNDIFEVISRMKVLKKIIEKLL